MLRSPSDRKLRLILGLLVFAVFGASVAFGFVYDDHQQLVSNPFIHSAGHLWSGLTSDVWGFKSPGLVWSNYWRPAFVFWNFLNWQIFGPYPAGWHLLNVALHLVVVLLAFQLLIRLRLPRALAFLAAAIFAVHPTRVESVVWIAGSTDVLAATGLLLALHQVLSWRETRRRSHLAGAVAAFAFAVLSKEVALAGLLLVPVVAAFGSETKPKIKGLVAITLPFVGVGLAFLAVRFMILGFVSRPYGNSVSWEQTFLSMPRVLLFYVSQSLWPVDMGVVHDFRAANVADLATFRWWIDLALAIGLVGSAIWASRRSPVLRLGFAFFIIPLIPAFTLRAFRPDDLVHERYLYLPTLGFAIVLGAALFAIAEWASHTFNRKWLTGLGTATIAAYSVSAFVYSFAWRNDVALWEQTAHAAPDSGRAWTELASAYQQAKRPRDSERAVERTLALGPPLDNTLTIYGMAAKDRGDLELAKKRLEQAVARYPGFYVGWEQLAIVDDKRGDFEGCIDDYRRAAKAVKFRRTLYTINLAVELTKLGRPQLAMQALLSIRDGMVKSAEDPIVRGLFYLGSLEAQLGRTPAAKRDLALFIERSQSSSDRETLQFRDEARARLRSLGG